MSVKKIDFLDIMLQFFSFVLGVMLILLFVPGMLLPVHAEGPGSYVDPNGGTHKYYYTFEYYMSPTADTYIKKSEVWSDAEIVCYVYDAEYDNYQFLCKSSMWNRVYGLNRSNNTYTIDADYSNILTVYVGRVISNFPFKIFDSKESATTYLTSGDTSGWLNPPPIDLEANGSLDENMPIPHITLHSHNQVDVSVSSSVSKYCHYVDNAAENYYIEVKGKWNSASDIELYRENLMWKSRVESVVSGALTTWISANDKFQSDRHFDFSDIENAVTAKNQLFADYPVESRNFYGGNNTIGDALTGKNAFIQDIKDFAIYGKPYTSPEFYVRFWYKDDNGYHYSKWTHFYEGFGSEFNQEEVPLQSDKGLTNDDLASVENGYSHTDPDLMPYDPGSGFDASMDSALSSFSETLKKFSDVSSGVTGMFVSIFSFLPWWSTAILGFAIVAVVILRFVGR